MCRDPLSLDRWWHGHHKRCYVRGVGAAGTSSGRPRRRRAYAVVNSTPYNRITACTYTHTRKTTTAAIEPLTRVKRDMSLTYHEKASRTPFHSSPVTSAPIQTSRKRTFAFGTK